MPSIDLDTKHWIKVSPVEDEIVKVTAKGFACYWSRSATPPEKASEGTELAENSAVTVEEPNGRWFRAKEPSSTEAPVQPCILEVEQSPTGVGGEEISTGQIDKEAITTEKIKLLNVTAATLGAKAVTAAKALEATVPTPAAAESLTAVAGTAGVARTINFAYTAKHEASAKVKLIHNLGTTAVTVTAFTTATKLPSEIIGFGVEAKGGIEKVKVESANEVLVTLKAAVPGAKEEFIYSVQG